MDLRNSFDTLSRAVEQIESRGRSVRDLEVMTASDAPGVLDVHMTLTVPLCAASSGTADALITPQAASISEGDGVTITCSVADLIPILTDADPIALGDREVGVEDGEIVLTVAFDVRPSDSTDGIEPRTDCDASRSGAASAAGDVEDPVAARLSAVRSDDVPAYDDTEYLRTLYESCGTFTEMSEHIEMDIAAETVRRYMIEADIHEPASYDTAAHGSEPDGGSRGRGDDAESTAANAERAPSPPDSETGGDEQLLTDGIGLPDGVTADEIVGAVADATSVYDVKASLDLGHTETRNLLRQFDLIDLVLHRIDDPRQGASRDDIVRRMRRYNGDA